ncbi:MAG: HEAT repeat domain-containing protein [Acidobacteria bacterium]|nr:HEAT repeat domain-containing protein [Acidobacteriota bacterium]
MTCDEAREQLATRWSQGLPEPERMALDGHLRDCSACFEEAEVLNGLWHDLGTMPQEEPSPNLRANFHYMMEAYRLGAESSQPPKPKVIALPVRATGSWLRRHAFAAATVAASLVVGLGVGHLYTSRDQDRQSLVQMTTEMQQMRQLVALSLMQQQSASDRLRGVSYSVQLEPADDEVVSALLTTLNTDSNVNVRLAAVDALAQLSSRVPVRQGLRSAIPRQDSPLVQIALIDWATQNKDRGALGSLQQLSKQSELHPDVRVRLASALQRLQ